MLTCAFAGDAGRADDGAGGPEGQVQGGGGAAEGRPGGPEEEQEEDLPGHGQADRHVQST